MIEQPRYRETAPPAALARHVACLWEARFSDSGAAHVERVIPDGCVDLIWSGEHLVVAGPDTTCHELRTPQPGARLWGLRFRPGAAATVLGLPASELLDARVEAVDVLGDRAARLIDDLHTQPLAVAAHVATWLTRTDPLDQLVARATERLRSPQALSELAAGLGITDRHLRRRFVHAVGYGPKLFERVMRLRRFVALASPATRGRLGEFAFAAGYADQAHLARDVRELADCTPTELVGYPVTAT